MNGGPPPGAENPGRPRVSVGAITSLTCDRWAGTEGCQRPCERGTRNRGQPLVPPRRRNGTNPRPPRVPARRGVGPAPTNPVLSARTNTPGGYQRTVSTPPVRLRQPDGRWGTGPAAAPGGADLGPPRQTCAGLGGQDCGQ